MIQLGMVQVTGELVEHFLRMIQPSIPKDCKVIKIVPIDDVTYAFAIVFAVNEEEAPPPEGSKIPPIRSTHDN